MSFELHGPCPHCGGGGAITATERLDVVIRAVIAGKIAPENIWEAWRYDDEELEMLREIRERYPVKLRKVEA